MVAHVFLDDNISWIIYGGGVLTYGTNTSQTDIKLQVLGATTQHVESRNEIMLTSRMVRV